MARSGPPKRMKTMRSRCGAGLRACRWASARRGALCQLVAPAILSPVLVRIASSTESPWPCGPPKALKTLERESTKPVAPAIFCRRCSSAIRTASSTERMPQYLRKCPGGIEPPRDAGAQCSRRCPLNRRRPSRTPPVWTLEKFSRGATWDGHPIQIHHFGAQ